ncbi:MAG: hypothetical protein ABF242_10645, partial [Flavobacteriales bacterium]
DNGNGTFTYTSEDGTITIYDSKDTNTTDFGQIGDSVFYVDGFGDTTKVFVNNDTVVTTLVNNTDSTFTYTSENGTVTTIDYKVSELTYFGQLGDSTYYVDENGDTTKVFATNETVTSITLVDDTLIYVNEDNIETKLFLADLDSTNEKIDTAYFDNDVIYIVEGGDTSKITFNSNDNDWDINANGTGLEAAAAGNNIASGDHAIAGGGSNTASGNYSTVSGGLSNTASGDRSVVGGGQNATASGNFSTVSGGLSGQATGDRSTVGGGQNAEATGDYSTVSGGLNNEASGDRATVSGGQGGEATGSFSTVAGGLNSDASGNRGTVSGGQDNTASGQFSSVSGGRANTATTDNSTVSGGRNNVASGTSSSVGGGNANVASGSNSTISGGIENTASAFESTVSGGGDNTASGNSSVVSGGDENTASGGNSVIAGGSSNTASQVYSTVSGGDDNSALGRYSTVSGGRNNNAYSFGEWVGGYFSSTYTPQSTTAPDNRDKLFVVGNGSSGSGSNALTLMKDGRLGLGVDGNLAQTATLHIKPTFNTSLDPLRVEDLNVAQANDTAILVTNPANGTVRYLDINSVGNDEDWFIKQTTNSPRSINDSIYTLGFVGIGTDNPTTQLHLRDDRDVTLTIEADADNSNEDDNPRILLLQDGGLVNGSLGLTGNPGTLYTGVVTNATYLSSSSLNAYPIQFVTSNTARTTILANGNFGINTTNPLNKLHLVDNSSADPFRVEGFNIAQANDTAVLVTNPANGTVRYLDLDEIGTVDSLSHLRTDTLSIHQGNSVSKVALANTMAEIFDVSGGFTLTNTHANITLATAGIVDANYSTTTNSITVTNGGRYKISYRVTTDMNGGNNRTETEYRATLNNAVIPGTAASNYHRNDGIGASTATVVKVVQLAAGDIIRVQGRRVSGIGVMRTKANGSSLLIERL